MSRGDDVEPMSRAFAACMRVSRLSWCLAAAGLVACAATLAWGATTARATDWLLPATDLFQPQAGRPASGSQQVSVAPDGTTTVVWTRSNGTNYIAQVATRPAGSATFGAPQDLSQPGRDAFDPVLAVAADGTTTVAWSLWNGSHFVVQAATRPAGSDTFSAPENLSDTSHDSALPQVAMASDGTTTAVWQQLDGAIYVIRAATRPAGSSTFGSPQVISGAAGAINPQLAVTPDGAATVTWEADDGPYKNIIQAATRPAGSGTFGAPENLSEGGQMALYPAVAVSPNGPTTVAWMRDDGTNFVLQAATRPAGSGTFSAPENLSRPQPGQDAAFPDVAIGPDRQTTITWQFGDGITSVAQQATRAPGSSTFSAPQDVSTPNAEYPRVAFAPDGTTIITWQHAETSQPYVVKATTRAAGSNSFSAPENLSQAGPSAAYPRLAVAPDGTATIAWVRIGSGQDFIQAVSSAPTKYEVTAQTAGTGAGTVSSNPAGISCGASCGASFNLSTPITLTATPAHGSTFGGWSGACSGSSPTCNLLILGNREATATFTTNLFRIESTSAVGSSARTRIRLPGPGLVTQRGRYRANGETLKACTTSRTASRAGYYTLTCRLGFAARKRREHHSLRVAIRTTFTPVGGTPRSTVRRVTFRAQRPRFAG